MKFGFSACSRSQLDYKDLCHEKLRVKLIYIYYDSCQLGITLYIGNTCIKTFYSNFYVYIRYVKKYTYHVFYI